MWKSELCIFYSARVGVIEIRSLLCRRRRFDRWSDGDYICLPVLAFQRCRMLGMMVTVFLACIGLLIWLTVILNAGFAGDSILNPWSDGGYLCLPALAS